MGPGVRTRFGTACVLAGGRGSRLEGMDKLRLEFGGERLLGRIAGQLSSRFTDLVAVCMRPGALTGLGYTVVPDQYPGAGPLAGLHAALLASRSDWVYLVACDMPFFSAAWVDALEGVIENAHGDAKQPVAAVARSGRFIEPFHAFYHVSLVRAIEAALSAGGVASGGAGTMKGNGRSIQSFIAGYPAIYYDDYNGFTGGLPLFFNINTHGDMDTAGAFEGEISTEEPRKHHYRQMKGPVQ